MDRINELLCQYCANGVEHKTLGELGVFHGGITGKNKNDFVGGNAAFITYKNVYSNMALDITPEDKVRIGVGENQRTLEYGDVIFTGSSETPDECGISSVVCEEPKEDLYLNSFCFFFRFNNMAGINPNFMKHVFRSKSLRNQIGKTASGVTRYNVSKKLMKNVIIPLPPIEVQNSIAEILDQYLALSEKLNAKLLLELELREKHYACSKRKILNDIDNRVTLKTVVKKSCSGGTPKKSNKDFYENGNIPWLRTQDVVFNEITEATTFITEEAVKKTSAKWIPENCVIVAISGASAGRCAINKFETTTNQHCLNLEIDETKAFYKFVFYCVWNGYDKLIEKKQGARGDLNSTLIQSLEIPLPSIEEQKRIAQLLDDYTEEHCKLLKMLQKEIEIRNTQYEYYRDKMLTFREAV